MTMNVLGEPFCKQTVNRSTCAANWMHQPVHCYHPGTNKDVHYLLVNTCLPTINIYIIIII